jgi:hypothetical protein
MKGQMFLILAVVIIVIVILLKASLNVASILEMKKYLESGFERMEFQNLRDEIVKVIQISYNQTNITANINEFVKFARTSFGSRAIDLNGIFVETIHPTVAEAADTTMNVTVYNFLGTDLRYLNLSLNGTERTYSSVSDNSIVNTNFNINVPYAKNYTLWIFYNTSMANYSDIFTIPIEIGKRKFVGFFDLRLVSSRSENRDKFIETVTLP